MGCILNKYVLKVVVESELFLVLGTQPFLKRLGY